MTYIPSAQDLDWTMKAIQGKHTWAVPSGGIVLTLEHNRMYFSTYVKMNPNHKEIDLIDRVLLNLAVLGYKEEKRIICEGANSVDDIVMNIMRWSEDDVESVKENSLRDRPHDSRFD
jgi:hypothetical protein|tara:strand:- start:51 stop:401 length:351 start_codon:yes stop_codon:yes gene_type:complete